MARKKKKEMTQIPINRGVGKQMVTIIRRNSHAAESHEPYSGGKKPARKVHPTKVHLCDVQRQTHPWVIEIRTTNASCREGTGW